jgi:hypothetical protein
MRTPPVNPFKTEESPKAEAQPEELTLPPMPDRVELHIPKAEPKKVAEEVIEGNGHDVEAGKQAVSLTEEEKEEARKQKAEDDELAKMREEAEDAKIPGSGSLFNVKQKHLPEFTRLNEREVFTFAVGNVQDYVLRRADTGEETSVYENFRDSIFRLKISLKGEGRAENVAVRQVDAEEKANAARGSMNGI